MCQWYRKYGGDTVRIRLVLATPCMTPNRAHECASNVASSLLETVWSQLAVFGVQAHRTAWNTIQDITNRIFLISHSQGEALHHGFSHTHIKWDLWFIMFSHRATIMSRRQCGPLGKLIVQGSQSLPSCVDKLTVWRLVWFTWGHQYTCAMGYVSTHVHMYQYL